MPDTFFDNPPVLQGDERTQIQQLSGYLFTISNKLNEALMEVTVREVNLQEGTESSSGMTEQEKQAQLEQYNSLKGMIVKTAEIVRTKMDEITTRLQTQVTAVSSQLGTMQTNLTNDIRATAEGVLQSYGYEERITGLEDEAGETDGFIRKTNHYIFSGLLDSNTMEYGIAIGEGVTAYDQNGNAYLNDNAKCATFTMNRLSFWQGSSEVAYFSSGKMYITEGEITNTLQVGNFIWKAMADKSIALISM